MGSIINLNIVKDFFTNNQIQEKDVHDESYVKLNPIKYRWTHGATDLHLGDGLLIYSVIQFMRAKTCVCLGSGGGFIPRIMSQARMELHEQEVFTGNKLMEWGDIGTTILVDASNGVGGQTDWVDEESFFRQHFPCRIILDTTENAFYNYFVKEDIKIDYLHIDAGHSYENVKQDFELYSQLLNTWGIISLKENSEWEVFNFFNNGILRTKPASTGLTFIQRCKK